MLKKIVIFFWKLNESKKYNSKNNLDAFYLLNNKEKIDELCELINVFSKGILKTEYNHVFKKFDCKKYDFISEKMRGSYINIRDDKNDSYIS